MPYNVYFDDGEHDVLIDRYENIFDALVLFYESVNSGSEGFYEGIELAVESIDTIETLDYHEF